MKNKIKISLVALAIAVSAAACSGDHSNRPGDSLKTDTGISLDNKSDTTIESGTNGSPSSIDSGMDNSSSGGTDTINNKPKLK